jgi:hypothetical protein
MLLKSFLSCIPTQPACGFPLWLTGGNSAPALLSPKWQEQAVWAAVRESRAAPGSANKAGRQKKEGGPEGRARFLSRYIFYNF